MKIFFSEVAIHMGSLGSVEPHESSSRSACIFLNFCHQTLISKKPLVPSQYTVLLEDNVLYQKFIFNKNSLTKGKRSDAVSK